jgi:hypothetical protein
MRIGAPVSCRDIAICPSLRGKLAVPRPTRLHELTALTLDSYSVAWVTRCHAQNAIFEN